MMDSYYWPARHGVDAAQRERAYSRRGPVRQQDLLELVTDSAALDETGQRVALIGAMC
jgi:hypothetical protein